MKSHAVDLLSRANLREGQRDFAIFLRCQLSAVGGGKNREARINANFRAPLDSCLGVFGGL